MGHANFPRLTDDFGNILGVFDCRGNQSLELKGWEASSQGTSQGMAAARKFKSVSS